MMFNEPKVAQMAAFLLDKGRGKMKYLKLLKMLYLADRESLKRHAFPMSGDRFVSMDHGPVLSRTFNLIKGAPNSTDRGWNYWVADKADYIVSLRRKVTRKALDEVSDADLDVLQDVHAKFGKKDAWELVEYTHRYCKEWVDPQGSSLPIKLESVFRAMGRNDADARKLAARIDRQYRVEKVLAAL